MQKKEKSEYKSIEEIRSALYPRGAANLGLRMDDISEHPVGAAKSLRILESIAQQAAESEHQQEDTR